MHEQQLFQIAKLRDRNVGRTCCLETLANPLSIITNERPRRNTHLDARNTHPNMRCLDHTHVIGTIPDGKQDRVLVLLDELDHKCLL